MKFVICLLVILGLGGVALAQENTPTPIFTPYPTPITDPWPFPDGLFCNDAEVGLGPTWNGLTIGESTLDELQALMEELSDNYTFRDDGQRGVNFSLFTHREALEKRIPTTVRACVRDNTIITLKIIDAATRTPSIFLEDWIVELGIPDAVTWDNVSTTRVVFWFEEGIAVSILVVEPFGASIFHIYFPNQPVEGYETRWPYNRTRTSPMQHHEGGTPPPSEQNPFDFEAILATITAQPRYSPISTLTLLPHTPTATAAPKRLQVSNDSANAAHPAMSKSKSVFTHHSLLVTHH